MKRIKGLDSIKFICAIAVMIGHFGFPLPATMSGADAHGTLRLVGTFINFIFNGPAAVIIFFIISGLCINYPFKDAKKIGLLPYYSRRLLRISLPAIAAIGLYRYYHVDMSPPAYGVLWSIFCEAIYYLIYPILFYINKRANWGYIVIAAYVISTTFSILHLPEIRSAENAYPAMDLSTWILGLPCWLLGCWLSVNLERFTLPSVNKIWLLRLLMIGSFIILRLVKFHLHLIIASNCFTLNAIAPFFCFWLGNEIAFYMHKQPWPAFERAGKWSYSLYLVHKAVEGAFIYYGIGTLTAWNDILLNFASLLLAYLFYLVIERPSHRFSVWISKLLTKENLAALPIKEENTAGAEL